MDIKAFRFRVDLGVVALLLLFLIGGGPAFAGEFKADLAIETPDMTDTMKILVKGNTYRLEIGTDSVTVLIRKRGTTWAKEPGKKLFRELDDKEERLLNPVAAWENLSYKMQGRSAAIDTVGDFECEIFTYNYKGDSTIVFRRWYTGELNFIIKQVVDDTGLKGKMELYNIMPGELDSTLFEIIEEPAVPEPIQDLGID